MNMYNERIDKIRRAVEEQFRDTDVSEAFNALTLDVNNFDELRSALYHDRTALTWIITLIERDWIDETLDA